MNGLYVVILALLAVFLCFLLLQPAKLAKLLELPAESCIRVRLIGALGILWVGLAIAEINPEFIIPNYSKAPEVVSVFRHYVGGAICGLLLALYTERLRRRSP